MQQSLTVSSVLLLAGCAFAPPPARPAAHVAAPEAGTRLARSGHAPAASIPASPSSGFALAGSDTRIDDVDAALAASQERDDGKGRRDDRLTIKSGFYSSTEDAVDDGLVLNASWTRFLNDWLGVEFEAGILSGDRDEAGADTDLSIIPLMVNGRAHLPAGPIDLYGGVGIGTIYYDGRTNGAGIDGWLLAGNAFLGGSIDVAEDLAVGLEFKYYLTDEIGRLDAGLDGATVMLTLGFDF